MSSFMCTFFMLILLSNRMFGIRVFFFSCITLLRDLLVLLHENSNSLFVGGNKDKAANPSTSAFVRCLIYSTRGVCFFL